MGAFKLSHQQQNDLLSFLRDLVRIPSPSTQEGDLAQRILAEMTRLGFDDVYTDRMGNVVGRITWGNGPTLMLNGHMDTVHVSTPNTWTHDPFGAEIERGRLFGVGACDMKGSLAAMIYGAHLARSSAAPLKGSLVVACMVQEETCEGLGARMLIEEEGLRPNWVVLGEPTDLSVSRGQRGRMEIRLVTRGRSAHAASPELGSNAIYKAARLAFSLDILNGQLGHDDFLGPGTLAVTSVTSRASSHNTIPDLCEMIIDRRLTLGENEAKALAEIERIIAREGIDAEVGVSTCQATSYTGYIFQAREFFPAWVIAEDHPLVTAVLEAARAQLKHRPPITCYQLSTDGTYTCGTAGIPSIGFGPGDARLAHTTDEHIAVEDVYAAAGVYARLAQDLLA